jgi:hypothetical protein
MNMLDKTKLKQLLALLEEMPTVEFKLKYIFSGQGRSKVLDELSKDLIALANTAGRKADEYAYLIVGAGDQLKFDGTRDSEDVRQYHHEARNFLTIANARCNPPIRDVRYDELEIDGTYYGVVSIPPSPHMHSLTRDLDTPKGLWRKGSVLIRHGGEVAVASFEEMVTMKREKERVNATDDMAKQISDLLSRVQSKSVPLSQCVAEALALARRLKHGTLEYICRKELAGWNVTDTADGSNYRPTYRFIEVFMGFNPLNMQYVGFGNYSNTTEFLRNSGEFTVSKMLISEPLSHLEAKVPPNPNSSIGSLETRQGVINPKAKRPDTKVYLYFSPFTMASIIEAVRSEVTRHLIDLLPAANG